MRYRNKPDRIEKFFYLTFALSLIVSLLFLSGFVYVVYKVLAYFGIL